MDGDEVEAAAVAPCQHERLRYGRGGFYLQCTSCPALWAAVQQRGAAGLAFDQARATEGLQGERVEPKFYGSGESG